MGFEGFKCAYFFPLVLIIGCGILMYKKFLSAQSRGMVVLLQGTSSAGKSALLAALQGLNDQIVVFKIDDWFPGALTEKARELGWHEDAAIHPWLYLHQYVTHKTGSVLFDTELRDALFNDASSFYQPVMHAVHEGKIALVDTVLESALCHAEFDDYFSAVPTLKVLVYCPLEVIVQRVAERNKKGGAEKRTTFQSFEQFPAIYGLQEGNKQVVDTVSSHAILRALDDAINELVTEGMPDVYVPKVAAFKEKFIERYDLDGHDHQLTLVALHHYDLILHSCMHDASQLAEQLQNFLKTKLS